MAQRKMQTKLKRQTVKRSVEKPSPKKVSASKSAYVRVTDTYIKSTVFLKRHWRATFFVVLALEIGFHLLRIIFTIPIHSDDTFVQNNLHWWQSGTHETTFLGTDNFFLKLPIYFILEGLNLSPRKTAFLTLIIFIYGMFLLFYYAMARLSRVFNWFHDKHLAVATLFLASNPGLYMIAKNLNVRNLEIGLAFLLLIPLVFIFLGKLNKKLLPILVLGMSIFLFSDPYFLYVFFVPLMAILLFTWRDAPPKSRRNTGIILGVLVLSILLAKLWTPTIAHFGVLSPGSEIHVAELNELPGNVKLWGKSMMRVFNADIRHPASNDSFVLAFQNFVLIAVLFIFSLYILVRCLRKKNKDPWQIFIAVLPITISVIYMLQPSEYLNEFRYLVIAPFGLAFILALLLETTKKGLRVAVTTLVLLLSLMNTLYIVPRVIEGDMRPNAINDTMVDFMTKRNLTKGYADYWSGNTNTYFSKQSIAFLQVYCNPEGRLQPMEWLVDSGPYIKESSNSFYIYDKEGFYTRDCSPEEAVEQLGRPQEVVDINEQYQVAIYNYDIYQVFDGKFPVR